jgi:hypothetical protein
MGTPLLQGEICKIDPDNSTIKYHYSPQATPQQSSYSPLPGYEPRFSPYIQQSMSDRLLPDDNSYHHRKPARKPGHDHGFLGRFRGLVIVLSVIAITFSTALAFVQEGIMLYMTIIFYRSEHHPPSPSSYGYSDPNSTRTGPWAIHTKLWPTYLLLVTSGLECVLGVCLLIITCCRHRSEMLFSIVSGTVQFLIWAGVAVFYRIGKTGDDLWGWSCSHKARSIQSLFEGVVDFRMACTLQVSCALLLVLLFALKWELTSGRHLHGSRRSRWLS